MRAAKILAHSFSGRRTLALLVTGSKLHIAAEFIATGHIATEFIATEFIAAKFVAAKFVAAKFVAAELNNRPTVSAVTRRRRSRE